MKLRLAKYKIKFGDMRQPGRQKIGVLVILTKYIVMRVWIELAQDR
jgi:hypothetical protein